ncbi:MAG: hypothetical protein DI528_22705 [Shinella sp.]|nr:MAG: hypothetical protein DI528_22705 [Shinella sp.]
MISKTLRLVVAALAIVGFFNVVIWANQRFNREEPEYVSALPSPDGKYKAVLATWAGGGGISPYCHERLTVVSAKASQEEMISGDNMVFESECMTGGSPSITWEGNEALQVGLAVSEGQIEPSTIKLRRKDTSGRIAIGFEILR